MGIRGFYVNTFEVFSKTTTKEYGVVKESLVSNGSFEGLFNQTSANNPYMNDKSTFVYTNKLYTDINDEIVDGRIVRFEGKDYDIVGQVNSVYKNHHLEVYLNRKE